MIKIRTAEERGSTDHGWLQSRHTFSFADYYDDQHMGVSRLRVINDDRVKPGTGFATHSHKDMEIISYVKKGTIEHKDSMGNIEKLPAGEFQLMSAGTGVTHSEYNPSTTEPLEFLQIWIRPDSLGVPPGYQQKQFENKTGMQLIVSPNGINGSLGIHQNVYLYQLILAKGTKRLHTIIKGRTVYVHVIFGSLLINGELLTSGDGAVVTELTEIEFTGNEPGEALVFDLP